MNEATKETIKNLKCGDIVTITYAGCMGSRQRHAMVVGRRSHSKKYNVTTIPLRRPGQKGPANHKIFIRETGISFGVCGMGAVIEEIVRS